MNTGDFSIWSNGAPMLHVGPGTPAFDYWGPGGGPVLMHNVFRPTGFFTIIRTGDVSAAQTITFSTSGTVPGSAYSVPGTTAVIPAGATSIGVEVSLFEARPSGETVVMTLTDAGGGGVLLGFDIEATVVTP